MSSGGVRVQKCHAFIVARVAAGEWAALGDLPARQRRFEASFLRSLQIGAPRLAAEHAEVAALYPEYAAFAPAENGPFFVASPGVRVRGGQMAGVLDLEGCAGRGDGPLPPLALEGVEVVTPTKVKTDINLAGAWISSLSLADSRFKGLMAEQCRIDGPADLRRIAPLRAWTSTTFDMDKKRWLAGLRRQLASGTIARSAADEDASKVVRKERWSEAARNMLTCHLRGARIGGILDLRGARIRGPRSEWRALNLAGCVIGGDVRLGMAEIEGGLGLSMMRLEGTFYAERVRICRGGDDAIIAESASVAGAFIVRRAKVVGRIWLLSADICGNLNLYKTIIDGGGGRALDGTGLTVRSTVLLRDFAAAGEMRFDYASVGEAFEVERAAVLSPESSITAPQMSVGGSARIEDAELLGPVELCGVNVGGGLTIRRSKFAGEVALDVSHMIVRNRLTVCANLFSGPADLSDLSCHLLKDEPDAWKGASRICLDGLTYARIAVSEGCFLDRARWLARQYASPAEIESVTRASHLPAPKGAIQYHPQPYLQLAKALSAQGHEHDARRILSMRRTIERRSVTPWLARPPLWLFEKAFDYGLSAGAALRTLAVCFAAGAIAVMWANDRGALVIDSQPVSQVLSRETERGGLNVPAMEIANGFEATEPNARCGHEINAVVYALDVFIPLIDLREEDKCEVGKASENRLLEGWTLCGWELIPEEQVWRFAKVLYAIIGWVVTSLSVLTFSGLLRRQAEVMPES